MRTHIGKTIKQKLEESNMSVKDFAKEINKERSNVYDIFRRESIDTDLLIKIGKVLNFNFFQCYIDEPVKNIESANIIEVSKKAKVLIEVVLNDDDILKLGLKEKVLQVLNQ